ncbi:MAG: flagellar hook-associated protein FlgL [Planctomycetota bacterium]
MRVTQGLLFQQALNGVNRHTAAIIDQQQQITTGRRWTRPSEDPTAASQTLSAQERKSTLERYLESVTQAKDRLSSSASAIQLLTDVLGEAKEVAINSINSTLTPADRVSLAQRLDSVIAQVLEVGNRNDTYGPLFAGTASGAPLNLENDIVSYQGNDGAQTVAIGDALSLVTNLPASELFYKQSRAKSAFFGGNTGAAPGTGTDSGLDRGMLNITHLSTSYGNGLGPSGGDTVSGIRPGASSVASDTVIGPSGAHTITIDHINKTLKLNGGEAVTYTGSETNLAISDGKGGTVHVNVSNITAGFQGTVTIAATGSLSTDGGISTIPINFTGNQVSIDSENGATTNVNSTNIRYAGNEVVDYSGTSSLFETLIGLRNDLLNYESMPEATRNATLQARHRELNRNFENALVSLADVGSRAKIAETAGSRLLEIRDEVGNVISNLQDSDFAQVVVDFNKSQLSLQLAQAAGQRLMQTNFLSFLQ